MRSCQMIVKPNTFPSLVALFLVADVEDYNEVDDKDRRQRSESLRVSLTCKL